MDRICAVLQPQAITIVGGGEPSLYVSGEKRLGDLISALGSGAFGRPPAIGLVTNGTLWPPGDEQWHRHVQWIRYSLDSASPESYALGKGRDFFDRVVSNVFRALTDTAIPYVGVGFLYHPGNIREAGSVISFLANRIRQFCPDQLHRFNVQFRPWRPPTGRPSIQEKILSPQDIEEAAGVLLSHVRRDSYLEEFARCNTNIAVNLMCGGARESIEPFTECFFGLAKTVIRADGSLYPCFRVAAHRDSRFNCGSILADAPLTIALRELHVHISSVESVCLPEHHKCLFCVFNDMFERGIADAKPPTPELAGEYFF
jgi:MoaA/NifB/PqqE/SkfB family radical SAM enzyme